MLFILFQWEYVAEGINNPYWKMNLGYYWKSKASVGHLIKPCAIPIWQKKYASVSITRSKRLIPQQKNWCIQFTLLICFIWGRLYLTKIDIKNLLCPVMFYIITMCLRTHNWEKNILEVKESEPRLECSCILALLEGFVGNHVRRWCILGHIMTNSVLRKMHYAILTYHLEKLNKHANQIYTFLCGYRPMR